MVCTGTGCVSNKSFQVKEALEQELVRQNLQDEIRVVSTGCNGFCAQGPIIVVQPDGIFYQQVTEKDIPHLVEEHFIKGRPVEALMYTASEKEPPIPKMADIGFFQDNDPWVLPEFPVKLTIPHINGQDFLRSLLEQTVRKTPCG